LHKRVFVFVRKIRFTLAHITYVSSALLFVLLQRDHQTLRGGEGRYCFLYGKWEERDFLNTEMEVE
jgi:hypothetical protein